MKQVIVNADDFGINKVVTAEIERMIEAGLVTSTTIMANGNYLTEVSRFAVLHPEVSFGVHLCLSEFDSLTKSADLHRAGITDESGRFVNKAIFSLNNFDAITLCAIRNELNAQIETIKALGFPISHADSHHHAHTIFTLKEVFCEVLKRQGIMKVRLGADFRSLRMKAHLFQWLKRNRLNGYYKKAFCTTNAFYSFSEFLKANCSMCDNETYELMCHPGHPGKKYRKEIESIEMNLLPKDIKLISYNDIH